VSFRFQGSAVTCTPFRTDDGEMVDLMFACPGCGQPSLTRSVGVVDRLGRLTVSHPVRCFSGCGLVLVIVRGVARSGGRLDQWPASRLQC
jgi:hypothetical protein